MSDASTHVTSVDVAIARSTPKSTTAVGLAVAEKGAVPRQLGLRRSAVELNGFEGKAGQTLAVPSATGVAVAVGIGAAETVDAAALRNAAAAFARCAAKHAHVATNLADVDSVEPRAAGQAVTCTVPHDGSVRRMNPPRLPRCTFERPRHALSDPPASP
jgi:leucyl aminopeptidase